MALRAFHSNPSLGGFGNENSNAQILGNPIQKTPNNDDKTIEKNSDAIPCDSSDALCQIVKELVDNAVDACQTAKKDHSRENVVHRVKVEILPYRNHEDGPPTLQVTVSDNGCGMKDIQACVNAFQSSKGDTSNTAGRYGIGLTLCLLHSQRLVMGTYSCVTSATKDAPTFKRALFFVNTMGDSIECHREEDVEKGHASESGTCVSLLVPGGKTAEIAWERLERYLRRLQLSSIPCSIEVLAPTLSRVPLHIHHRFPTTVNTSSKSNDAKFTEGLDSDSDEDYSSISKLRGPCMARRKEVLVVAQKYGCFGLPLNVQNISHSEQEIRIQGLTSKREDTTTSSSKPQIIIDMIVSPHDESETSDNSLESTSAHLELVRMVNSVPMLESTESISCGLVHAVQKSAVWASFGLTLSRVTETDTAYWRDDFGVRDSDQVAPYFQSHKHQQWEANREKTLLNSDEDEEDNRGECNNKRKRKSQHKSLLPAKVRLGKILVIVNVVATPNVLPLPTLSKGRLPINHSPIMNALHLALRECLRSLQQTSSGLLLTTAQLRSVERDVRYIPLLANAATSILHRMQNRSRQLMLVQKVQQMRLEDHTNTCTQAGTDVLWNAHEILRTIENRTMDSVRSMELAKRGKKNRKKSSNTKEPNHDKYAEIENSEDDSSGHDCRSQEKSQASIDVPFMNLDTVVPGKNHGDEWSSETSEKKEVLLDSSPNGGCTVSCSDDEWW